MGQFEFAATSMPIEHDRGGVQNNARTDPDLPVRKRACDTELAGKAHV